MLAPLLFGILAGHGGPLATPAQPSTCVSERHRQFDFWVGDWEVQQKDEGEVEATDRVTKDLDGCVILERWDTATGGQRGRSMSSFDSRTGQWHQTWVTEGVTNSHPLRMAGGLRSGGAMTLSGVREPYRDRTATWLDQKMWNPGRREITLANSGKLDFLETDSPAKFKEMPTNKCSPSGDSKAARRLDFMKGKWSVYSPTNEKLGQSEINADASVSNCLLEESFDGDQHYRALGWFYYDPVEDRYYRTIADNAGNRIELGGQFANDGSLVLMGALPGESATLRMTLSPRGKELRFLWDVSRDGGATFVPRESAIYK
jgi:hypothetical protein